MITYNIITPVVAVTNRVHSSVVVGVCTEKKEWYKKAELEEEEEEEKNDRERRKKKRRKTTSAAARARSRAVGKVEIMRRHVYT